MDAAAPGWLVELEASGLGAAIRQSAWIYPAANIAHVVSVTLFAGAVAVLDLTLLGAIRPAGRAALLRTSQRCAGGFLVAIVIAGLVLFIAEASHVALNPVFQLKLLLIGLGLANAIVLGGRSLAALAALPDDAALPPSARTAALVSLGIWLAVAGLGRYIAYH